jgi:hypothetical protein
VGLNEQRAQELDAIGPRRITLRNCVAIARIAS